MINFKNLTFSYGKKAIFKQLNLSINESSKGKVVGIIGPNGSGKSTLVNLLMHYELPHEGDVSIRGKSLSQHSRLALAKEIGHLSQSYQRPFDYLVEDYIAMGHSLHAKGYNYHSKDAKERANHYMDLTDTQSMAKQSIKQLSGGEFQRVRLARVLTQNTPIILLDEALSAMDIAKKASMMRLLRLEAERENKLIIMVMHDLQLAYQLTDEIIVFSEGELVAKGLTKDVLTEALIDETFNVRTTFFEDEGFIVKF